MLQKQAADLDEKYFKWRQHWLGFMLAAADILKHFKTVNTPVFPRLPP